MPSNSAFQTIFPVKEFNPYISNPETKNRFASSELFVNTKFSTRFPTFCFQISSPSEPQQTIFPSLSPAKIKSLSI